MWYNLRIHYNVMYIVIIWKGKNVVFLCVSFYLHDTFQLILHIATQLTNSTKVHFFFVSIYVYNEIVNFNYINYIHLQNIQQTNFLSNEIPLFLSQSPQFMEWRCSELRFLFVFVLFNDSTIRDSFRKIKQWQK